MAGNMNEENHESKALINKLIFLILFHQTDFRNFTIFLHARNFYVRGWEISQT